MAPVHETLIRQLAGVRAAAQPALASRCDKAVALVLTGKVHLAGATQALVDSYREPGVQYTVNRTCACQDAKHGAPDGWCAHRIAVHIVRALPPAPVAAPLPEATFSITLKGTMGGHEVLLTARGQTWEEFTTNVDRLSGLLDAPAQPTSGSPPSAHAAAQPTPDGWCVRHAVQMKLNHGKDGREWYSHRTDEGWCKGK